jgi:hypothetical protein
MIKGYNADGEKFYLNGLEIILDPYTIQVGRFKGRKGRDERVTIEDPAKLQWCLLDTEKKRWQVYV